MIPILLEGPAVEPVTLAEMRAYLRLDDGAEDDLVAALLRAARGRVEAETRRVLIAQSWRLVLDRWPPGRMVASPISPLTAIDAIRVRDAAGAATLVGASLSRMVPDDPPQILVEAGAPEPGQATGGIEIDLVAGYGPTPASVPEPLRQAVRLLVARSFEHRGDGEAGPPPAELAALVAPFRRARL